MDEDLLLNEKSSAMLGIGSYLTDKQLRKMAKRACNGHQHAMRYKNMLNACFKMGEMVLQEIERQKDSLQKLLSSDSFQPNDKYNFPIGTEYFVYKEPTEGDGELIKCKTTGRIWISPELGGVYECAAESEVEGIDCNWNTTYSKSTSITDSKLFEAYKRGDKICK